MKWPVQCSQLQETALHILLCDRGNCPAWKLLGDDHKKRTACCRTKFWVTFAIHPAMQLYKRPYSWCKNHPANHDTSTSTFNQLICTFWIQSFPGLMMKIMFTIRLKLNLLSSLKWNLDKFSSTHTTFSSAKVSLAFAFFLLMRGLVTEKWAFSPNSVKRCPCYSV